MEPENTNAIEPPAAGTVMDSRLRPIRRSPAGRTARLLLVVLCVGLFLLSPAEENSRSRVEANSQSVLTAVQSVIDAVTQAGLTALVSDLSGASTPLVGGIPFQFQTRNTFAVLSVEKATQYAYDAFTALHLDVQYQNWTYAAMTARNVIAVQPGSATPPCIYIVLAHLDSTAAGNPKTLAPGADDNASGAAAVLMLAQALNQVHLACTIRYILVTGEEQGLYGSAEYVNAISGEPIQGVIVLDMLAYNSDTNAVLDLTTRTNANGGGADLPLAEAVKDVISSFSIPLLAQDMPDDSSTSDHWSFWEAGIPAILIIEDTDDFNPYYHTTGDTLAKLDLVYYTNIVKSIAGAVANLASQGELPYHAFLPVVSR